MFNLVAFRIPGSLCELKPLTSKRMYSDTINTTVFKGKSYPALQRHSIGVGVVSNFWAKPIKSSVNRPLEGIDFLVESAELLQPTHKTTGYLLVFLEIVDGTWLAFIRRPGTLA